MSSPPGMSPHTRMMTHRIDSGRRVFRFYTLGCGTYPAEIRTAPDCYWPNRFRSIVGNESVSDRNPACAIAWGLAANPWRWQYADQDRPWFRAAVRFAAGPDGLRPP